MSICFSYIRKADFAIIEDICDEYTNNTLQFYIVFFQLQAAAMDAPSRKQCILQLFKQADFRNDLFLKEFGFRINPKMVETTARVIPPPAILFGENPEKVLQTLTAVF